MRTKQAVRRAGTRGALAAKWIFPAVALVLGGIATFVVLTRDKDPTGGGGGGEGGGFVPVETRPLDPDKVVDRPDAGGLQVKGSLLVSLHRGVGEEQFLPVLAGIEEEAQVVGRQPMLRSLVLELPEPELLRVRQQLANHPYVATCSLNFISGPTRDFDDPALTNADPVDDWGLTRIGAREAWDIGIDSVTIGIVDSGSLLAHEELAGNTRDPYSYATMSGTMQNTRFVDRFGDTHWVAEHGTHVAVTAGGISDNGKGTAGVSPSAEIIPMQVLYYIEDPVNGPGVGGSTEHISAGIVRAIEKGAKVINLSLGNGWRSDKKQEYWAGDAAKRRELAESYFLPIMRMQLEAYKQAIDYAESKGVILIKAAGNDNIPAEFDGMSNSRRVISVAAATRADGRAEFSNYGSFTTVSAPGTEIYSAWSSGNSDYESIQGTSMAAPHVAGLVALMKAIKPDLSRKEAAEILVNTGTKLSTDQPIGPLINARAALEETRKRAGDDRPPPDPDPPLVPDPPDPDPKPDPDPGPEPPPEPPKPTPDEMLAHPTPWIFPEIQRLIDLWLSIAVPRLEPVDGRPWFYDEWGRALNNYTAWAFIPPDHGGMTRHQWVWQFAKGLDSVAHDTLYNFVVAMLRSGRFDPMPPPPLKDNPKPPLRPPPDVPRPPGGDQPPPPPDPELGKRPVEPGERTRVPAGLLGRWSGKPAEGDRGIAITFINDREATWDRWGDGREPEVFVAIDLERSPAALDLFTLKDGQPNPSRTRCIIEPIDAETMRLRTSFNNERPVGFDDESSAQTYILKRDASPELVFQSLAPTYSTVSELLVGGPAGADRVVPGSAYKVDEGWAVISKELSGDAKVAWMILYRGPKDDTPPGLKVVSIGTDGKGAAESALPVPEGARTRDISIHVDGTGARAYLAFGRSIPRAVQPKRVMDFYVASRGGAFSRIGTTETLEGIAGLGASIPIFPHATSSGAALYFTDNYTLYRVAVGGGVSKVFALADLNIPGAESKVRTRFSQFALSPDGSTWAGSVYLQHSADSNRPEYLMLKGTPAGGLTVLARGADFGYSDPTLSADGTTVAYHSSSREARTQLWVQRGAAAPKLIEPPSDDYSIPRLSADGRQLAVAHGRKGTSTNHALYILDLQTGAGRRVDDVHLLSYPSAGFRLSPDGSTLSCLTKVGGQNGIYVQRRGIAPPAGYPKLGGFQIRLDPNNVVHIRIRQPEGAGEAFESAMLLPLLDGYTAPTTVLGSRKEPNPLFRIRFRAGPFKAMPEHDGWQNFYFPLDGERAAFTDRFSLRLMLKNKDGNRVTALDFPIGAALAKAPEAP